MINWKPLICTLFLLSVSHSHGETTPTSAHANTVANWIEGGHRSEHNMARNDYRHPVETLDFFGLKADMSALEIWPGGGWYTEILAPYLKPSGQFYAAQFSPSQTQPFFQKMRKQFEQKLQANPALYSEVKLTSIYPPGKDFSTVEENSLDMILTFRNVHNWSKGGFDQAMFDHFFKLLKPQGILGVVEHRAKPGTRLEDMISSGYMTQDYVIKLASNAGFSLAAHSEINANSKDSTQHPNGVWSLPPSLRGGDQNREAFQAIGESDRMTLKFIKGEKP